MPYHSHLETFRYSVFRLFVLVRRNARLLQECPTFFWIDFFLVFIFFNGSGICTFIDIASKVEVPSGKDPSSDRVRRNLPLIRPFQINVTTDQTNMRSKHRVRLKCARNCLWSDLSRRKGPLIRPKSDHCPDDYVTMAQTNSRPSSRRFCAQNHFWSDFCALKSHSWSDYCALEITSPHKFCYNIFISKKLMFALLSASKEKTSLKWYCCSRKQKLNFWEKVYLVYISAYFELNGWI